MATTDSLSAVEDTTITSVTSRGIYADGTDGPVLIRARTGTTTALPAETSAPSVIEAEHAVIIADKLDTPTAYTVEATG